MVVWSRARVRSFAPLVGWFHYLQVTLGFVLQAVTLHAPIAACFQTVRFSSVLFFTRISSPQATHALPKHAMRLLRRTQPCGTAALPPRPLRRALLHTRSHTCAPSLHAQRISSRAGVPVASHHSSLQLWSSHSPPTLASGPSPGPTATSHAMFAPHGCAQHCARTPRAVSSPFHGNTYRGTHIRAMSPGGLTAWPGAGPKS